MAFFSNMSLWYENGTEQPKNASSERLVFFKDKTRSASWLYVMLFLIFEIKANVKTRAITMQDHYTGVEHVAWSYTSRVASPRKRAIVIIKGFFGGGGGGYPVLKKINTHSFLFLQRCVWYMVNRSFGPPDYHDPGNLTHQYNLPTTLKN